MLPEAEDCPSLCFEVLSRLMVPGHVFVELGPPPLRVRLGMRGMLGAAMPEAAIHEDSDFGSREGDVDRAAGHAWYGQVHSIPHACCVQEAANGHLRSGVARTLATHAGGDTGG